MILSLSNILDRDVLVWEELPHIYFYWGFKDGLNLNKYRGKFN